MKQFQIGRDYSDAPAGRYRKDGPFSGERFREDFLIPELLKEDVVNVDLSGVAGYGSSFLEEVFGGLVRKWDGTKDEVSSKLQVIAPDPRKECYRLMVEKYMSDAWNCKNGNA